MGYSLASIKLRVTDYSRVSTDHLEQQKSLKNQVEHFEEMIKSNENWTYIQGYIDNGISGTTDYKRNNFMKMIEDARNNKFDLIVTKEISRFSRNTLDSIKYTRELLSYGVAVLFVNDNINTALPDSELRLTIMASMAQDEIRRLSDRVKFGMNRSIKNGTILGNNMLYGYKKDKLTGNLVIVEEEANIVKRLFSLYAIDNWSISRIAKTFNNEGIKTCQNKKWCISTLTRMIKNPKYKGYYCGKKTEIIDYMTKKVKIIQEKDWILYEDKIRIPPIIEDNLWKRANIRLKKRKKVFGNDYQKDKIMYQNRYPLSAKIYCSNHNQVFHRRKQCKSCNDITWICAKYLKEGKKACNSPNIRESEIYTIFDDVISALKIDLSNLISYALELLPIKANVQSEIEEFFTQRLIIFLNDKYKKEVLEACAEKNPCHDLCDYLERVKTVSGMRDEKLIENANRVLRILKEDSDTVVNDNLFIFDAERELFSAVKQVNFNGSYDNYLKSLIELNPTVTKFFDEVLVMDNDEKIKNNRIALLNELKNKYIMLTDFSKISV